MNIDLFTQTDPRWNKESMAIESDTIETYGCLLTCYSNTTLPSLKQPLTPFILNLLLKSNYGYFGLVNRNCSFDQTSFIMHTVVANILSCKINTDYKEDLINSPNIFYIGEIVYSNKSTHFINILSYEKLKSSLDIFDVYYGVRKTVARNVIKKIIEVKY